MLGDLWLSNYEDRRKVRRQIYHRKYDYYITTPYYLSSKLHSIAVTASKFNGIKQLNTNVRLNERYLCTHTHLYMCVPVINEILVDIFKTI